jgi:glycosyltransferase involved in cell wall biosynthesis
MVGDGMLKSSLMERSAGRVEFLPFLQPEELMKELQRGGVACIPSYREQWGVVIHEYAVLGMPMIASSACGAVSEFLVSGYNGYIHRNRDSASLTESMLRMTEMTDEELRAFADNSAVLGARINPELSAHSLLSAIYMSGI